MPHGAGRRRGAGAGRTSGALGARTFQATPVSAELYDRLDRAAANGDRKLLVRLLLNEVVRVNTGSRVPRLVFPLLFRSPFGRMVLANALAIPTGLRAFEAYDWNAQDLSTLDMPVTFLIGSKSPPFNRRFPGSVASRIPHATIEVIDGGSHGIPWSSRTASPRYSISSAPAKHGQTAQVRRDGAWSGIVTIARA